MSESVGHGRVSADALRSIRMSAQENPFTRLFDEDGPQHAVADLVALQTASGNPRTGPMIEAAGPLDSETPAGFTFFGQFIDHDLTLTIPRQEPGPPLEQLSSRHQFFNARSGDLDLDSVFGFGPEHDLDNGGVLYRPDYKLKTGPDTGNSAWDLARDARGVALIGDPRNDENVILAQLHASFVHAYNRMYDEETGTRTERYIAARLRLMQTYQFIVLNDYVARFVPPEVLQDVTAKKAPVYAAMMAREPRSQALIPIEFAVAVFRFGHSQVRPGYRMNRGPASGAGTFPVPPPPPDPSQPPPVTPPPPPESLNGGRPVPENLAFNHALFFSDATPRPAEVNVARKIDTRLARPLFFLRFPGIPKADEGTEPDGNQQLAKRNLLRGRQMRLVDAQRAAHLAGVAVLTPEQIDLANPQLRSSTPLWFYTLREAEIGGGERLGPLGGRLMAETFVGILNHAQSSFVRLQQPGWTPPGDLTTMARLLAYAGLPIPAGR